ncbi:MAG: hypothetical protein GXY21_07655 [Clostridiaceae bacterium]|nr:hypothetical protein [Clostridiaceae bacterium]
MKKIKVIAIILTLVLTLGSLVACTPDVVLENTEKDYYVTGQFAGWGDAVGKDQFRMTAVSLKDARVAALKADLKGAKYLYILENVVISDTGAGWTAQYVEGGVVKECDGNQTMKWLQVAKGQEAPDWWAQSPESGEIKNLTPDLLWIPGFTETPEVGPDWNGNPVVLKAGTYTVVFAVLESDAGLVKYAGLIAE